ncbi:MAG: PASTA domain-containing protein [Desulfofustis sp.]|nr:PASTA domain-containing protein [Desulfofustis sp.]
MGKRSRLRTQNVGRRRLIVLIVLFGAVAAAWAWLESERTLLLWEQVGGAFDLGKNQSVTDQEVIRGTIYDRNYKEFAISYERVSVYANIREIEDVNQVIGPLSAILETSEGDLYDRMGKGRLRVWLAKDISQDQEDEIKKLGFQGIHLHREYIRYYPQGESAAHLIGFVERDTGLFGIEQYLNKLEARIRLNKDDTQDLPKMGDTRPGVDGRHLILTLDGKIQRILDDYLKRLSAANPGNSFGALVMEASTGGLIGYTQIPSFDPNKFHRYSETNYLDLFNERIAVPEVFKLFLRELSLLESQGSRAAERLPWSVGAEKRKLGVQLQLWNRLGADGGLQVDFITSSPPKTDAVVFKRGETKQIDFETVPEMQTPLELLTALTRALNGGYEITPHGAKRYVLRRNQQEFLLENLEKEPDADLLGDGISAEAKRLARLMGERGPLSSLILQGESRSVIESPVKRLFHHYLGLILIPRVNPDLVLLVTSTGPGYQVAQRRELSPAGEAKKIIGPIAALQQVMKNLADMMSPKEQDEMNFRLLQEQQRIEDSPEVEAMEMVMPSFKGMSLRRSLRLLQGSNVEIELQGTGRVVSQHPPAGTKIQPGTRVTLILERDQVDPAYRRPQFAEPE